MKKILLTSAVALTFLFTASATPVGGGENRPTVEMSAAGRINKQPVYQLRLNNEQAARYYILVKDEFGETLYEEYVSGKNISRNYQLNTMELGNTAVVFEVYNTLGWLTGSFRISPLRPAETAVLHNTVR